MNLTFPSSATSALRGRLSGLFILNGLLYASWAVQIPAVQQRAHLDTTQLSGLLFALTAGTLLSLPLARRVLVTRGARLTGVMSLLFLTVPLALLGMISFLPVAVILAFLFGLGFGGMDFTLNSVGGWLEEQIKQPIMSALHGSYSLGTLAGAAIGVVLIGAHVTLPMHLMGVGAAVLLAGLLGLAHFPKHGTGTRPAPDCSRTDAEHQCDWFQYSADQLQGECGSLHLHGDAHAPLTPT
jgi:predicted MFS family arabinose efflux permease